MSVALTVERDVRSARIMAEVHHLLLGESPRTDDDHPAVERLWAVTATHVGGGKLVRPLLLLDIYGALDGPENEAVVRIAAAVELLHFAFLLHDDVIDGDTSRRGRPNLVGELARDATGPDHARVHWGRTGGILAGDLVLSRALRAVARAPLDQARRNRILDLFDDAITESVAGEWMDVGLADGQIAPDIETVVRMTGRKTSGYSFELPLRSAAILAGRTNAVADRLADAGRRLGLAFQLQDDLLSAFGDAARHGKDPLSDLREGKETTLVAYARQTSRWGDLDALLSSSDVDAPSRAAALLDECGARDFVSARIDTELAAIDELAGDPLVPAAAADVLLALRGDLVGRAA